jgi:hypothetical protein
MQPSHQLLPPALQVGAGLKICLKAYLPASEGGTKYVKPQGAWMLCICYAASLHIMALIRACHFIRFDQQDDRNVLKLGERLGISHLFIRWWVLVFLSPVPGGSWARRGHVWIREVVAAFRQRPTRSMAGWRAGSCAGLAGARCWSWLLPTPAACPPAAYFIPFGRDQLGVTGILACLAGHGLLVNLLETWITHTVEGHPSWQEFLDAEAAAREAHKAKHGRAIGSSTQQAQDASASKEGQEAAGEGEGESETGVQLA